MRNKLARIISLVFNAYTAFILTYYLALFIDIKSIPNYIAIAVFILISLATVLMLFKSTGLISDFDITKRKQRPLFNLAIVIPTFIFILIASTTTSVLFLYITILLFITNIVTGIVSKFWKISGHMIYVSIFATFSYLYFQNAFLGIFWIIVIPTLAWSRVILKKHTILQVIAGTVVGTILTLIILR